MHIRRPHLLAFLALTACAGDPVPAGAPGPGGSPPGGPTAPADDDDIVDEPPIVPLETVEERIAALGIPTLTLDELEPLTDRTGRPLPAGAHPLRDPVSILQGPSELVLIGPGGGAAVVDLEEEGLPGQPPHVVATPSGGLEALTDPVALAVHADGDGREEIVVVAVSDFNPDTANDLVLWMAEDAEDGYATPYGSGQDVAEWRGASAPIAAARFDPDGDGVEDVLVAARVGDTFELRTVSPLTGAVGAVIPGGPWLAPTLTGEALTGLTLATGQLDGDPAHEVALMINTSPEVSGPFGHSRLIVYDLQGGTLVPVLDQVVEMADGRPVVAGGVVLADIDADFVDEVVVAGADTALANTSYRQLLVAWDDLVSPSATPMFEGEHVVDTPASAQVRLRTTQLNAGSASLAPTSDTVAFDPAEDVLVDHVLWEWTTAGLADPADPPRALTPRAVFTLFNEGTVIEIDPDRVRFAFGHFDGDGLPDAAVYTADSNVFDGISGGLPAGGLFTRSLVLGSGTDREAVIPPDAGIPARLVAANVDDDAIVVQHLPDLHALAYSEPVILAAIAAPPCYAGPMGQNTGSCAATLGATHTASASSSDAMSVSAGMHVGINVAERVVTQTELEAVRRLEFTATAGLGESTTLTYSRAYTNGSDQDHVLATVMGFEQFAYLVLEAPPGLEDIEGELVTVSIPRDEAVTTRLYADTLIRPSMRASQREILDRVFDHVPTEPQTYLHPDALPGRMAALGVTGTSGCDEQTAVTELELCGWLTHAEPVPAPAGVGPLSGVGSSDGVSLVIGSEEERWTSWGASVSIDLELTAGGVMVGASVGTSAESTVGVTHGDAVEFGLVLGAVDPLVYPLYSASLYATNVRFDCVEDDVGLESCDGFQVLGFTVE